MNASRFLWPQQKSLLLRASIVLLLLAIVIALYAAPALAQRRRSETERRLRALQQQIAEDERRLKETNEAMQSYEQRLRSLDRRIAKRQELVRLYQKRLNQIERDEQSMSASLHDFSKELKELKGEYQRHASHAYKYGRLHDLALLLAADSINEMLVRARYLRRFTQQRKRKLEDIQETSRAIKERQTSLKQKRDSTTALLSKARQERRNLAALRESRNTYIRQLKEQSEDIKENLDQKQSSAQDLQSRLKRMARRETRRLENASPERRAAARRLTGSFQQNKGQLPWPSQGVITQEFGMQVDPVYGTKTPNIGIFIDTRSQAEIMTVFQGEVIRVGAMPDFGKYLMVQHGEYKSLYSNLSMLYVSEGDQIEAGTVLGRAGTDKAPRGTGVFFAIFNGGQEIDPQPWLQPQ